MAKSAAVKLEVSGRTVSITSPDKIFFPERGDTKLDLARYYIDVEGPLLETMGGRPLLMQRYPNGATGSNFFQKRVPENHPDWLTTAEVSTPNGTTSDALVAADLAHVLWAVNQGCLGFHVWPNRAETIDIADELRIDLDPSPGVDLPMLREAAHEVHALLGEFGIAGYPKTTGSRGIHIYVRCEPRWNSFEVRAAAVALAREMERRRPEFMTWQWWKEERGSRVFIDFNQNAPHKTVFGAWCVRATPDGRVSTPIGWDEVDTFEHEDFTIATVPARLAEQGDPWRDMYDAPQDITALLEMSEHDMASGLMDAPWPPVYPKQPNEPPRVAPSRAKHVEPD